MRYLMLIVAMLVGGCATDLSTWQGQGSDRVLAAYGQPDRAGQLADGRQLWEYHRWQQLPCEHWVFVVSEHGRVDSVAVDGEC